MSYDGTYPPELPKCICKHSQNRHEFIGQTGIIPSKGVSVNWYGRCTAKKCSCWRFKEKPWNEIEHLAKLVCGHIQPFAKRPIPTWWEWCEQCQDFRKVIEGVSRS